MLECEPCPQKDQEFPAANISVLVQGKLTSVARWTRWGGCRQVRSEKDPEAARRKK